MLRRSPRRVIDPDLNLTSMMDLFTIILVFLLKAQATNDMSLSPSRDLVLPISSADASPELAVSVVLSRREIRVDGEAVVGLTTVPDEEKPGQLLVVIPPSDRRGELIGPLYDHLVEKASVAMRIGEASGRPEHQFKGRILLQADRGLPYALVRDVMITAGKAHFGEFKFVVLKEN